MAGLFDSLGIDPVAAAKIADARRQQEQQDALFSTMSRGYTPGGQAGLALGLALGQGIGRGVASKLPGVPDSPEMEVAKKQAAVIKVLQDSDLATSAGLRKAAAAARDAGDDVTALKLLERAGQTELVEKTTAAETTAKQRKMEREEWNALPTSVQEEIIAADPTKAVEFGGVTDPEALQQVQARVAERNEFQRAKLRKAAEDVGRATAASWTNNDEQLAISIVNERLSADDFLSGVNTSKVEALAPYVAARASKIRATARDRNETVSPEVAMSQAYDELLNEGVISVTPGKVYGTNVELDLTKIPGMPGDKADKADKADVAPADGRPQGVPADARKAPDGNWYSRDPATGKYIKY